MPQPWHCGAADPRGRRTCAHDGLYPRASRAFVPGSPKRKASPASGHAWGLRCGTCARPDPTQQPKATKYWNVQWPGWVAKELCSVKAKKRCIPGGYNAAGYYLDSGWDETITGRENRVAVVGGWGVVGAAGKRLAKSTGAARVTMGWRWNLEGTNKVYSLPVMPSAALPHVNMKGYVGSSCMTLCSCVQTYNYLKVRS